MDKLGLLRRAAKAEDHTDPVEPDTPPVEPASVDECIFVWSMRPQPGTPTGDAWEAGARQGWAWLKSDYDSLLKQLQVAQQERDEKRLQWQNWRSRMGLTASATELLERAEKAEAELDEFKRDAEQKKSEALAVIRKLLEALTHPNPPTSGQWEAIRVEARKQIAAIDSEKEGK